MFFVCFLSLFRSVSVSLFFVVVFFFFFVLFVVCFFRLSVSNHPLGLISFGECLSDIDVVCVLRQTDSQNV